MQIEETKDRGQALRAGLAMHTGSEHIYRHWTGTLRFTDGVKYLGDEAGAYWLIDNIAWASMTAKLADQDFVFWKLQVHADRTATLSAEDGDDRVLLSQPVPWTDFPLEEVRLLVTNNTLLLPSEY